MGVKTVLGADGLWHPKIEMGVGGSKKNPVQLCSQCGGIGMVFSDRHVGNVTGCCMCKGKGTIRKAIP